MSLANKTCWVVGGVGVIGRGIARDLLKSGATVIVNSRSEGRLAKIATELGDPDRLITIHGSLLPGHAEKTVSRTLSSSPPLDHVVAHGAVRYWGPQNGKDETHSLLRGNGPPGGLLEMGTEDFASASSHLAALHFAAAQQLIPRLQFSSGVGSYTFVTGDGGGHPEGRRSALGELNAHHVWGLSAALRNEPLGKDRVNVRELRVRMAVNRPEGERADDPRDRPLSEDVGALCAGLAVHPTGMDDHGELVEVTSESLGPLLARYAGGGDEDAVDPKHRAFD